MLTAEELKKKYDEVKALEEKYKKVLIEVEDKQKQALKKEEQDRLINEILARVDPNAGKNRVKFFCGNEPEQKEKDVEYKDFGAFLKMVKNGDSRISHMRRELTDEEKKTAMSTTNAQGGYTIPSPISDKIINEINNAAEIPGMTTPVQMTSGTLSLNSLLTDLTVAWSTEATDKTTTKPTFSQGDLTLRFIYAMLTRTIELGQDTLTINEAFLRDLVSQGIALELEEEILSGNGNPHTGVLNATGVNAVAQAGAALAYDDLVDVVTHSSILRQYHAKAVWVGTLGSLGVIMKLKDLDGRPLIDINRPLDQGIPLNLLSKRFIITDQIADTISSGGTSSLVYGDMKQVLMGKRAGHEALDVLFSNTAVISSSTAVSENCFTENKEAWRFELRRAIRVGVPAAFAKLTGLK